MPDVHDPATRSRNMAAIRGSNTGPEILLRSALHRAGLRFRLHRKDLPGKPDLVLKKYRATIFVNGCFWHSHNCPYFRQPGGSNAEFWRRKLARNAERDREVTALLAAAGWRQMIVWECALKGRGRQPVPAVVQQIRDWLASPAAGGDLAGNFGTGS